MLVTPKHIYKLEPDQVFVFGSNTEGRHGAGAAWLALKYFGAVYGQAYGYQGQSFAIITKDLKKGKRSISLNSIRKQIKELYRFALWKKDYTFFVTKIGSTLAGYTVEEIATHCFKGLLVPPNVALPQEIWDIINTK